MYLEGEFKHEVRQFQKPYDNQQAEQISLIVKNVILKSKFGASALPKSVNIAFFLEMIDMRLSDSLILCKPLIT